MSSISMTTDLILKILFVFLLAISPSLIWLGFYLKRDPRPEPRRFLLLVFLLGGLIIVFGSQIENVWLKPVVQDNRNIQLGSLLFLFLYPFIEEILKFLAARIGTIKNKFFMDESTDTMVYMITAALGFAAAENLRVFFITILEGSYNINIHGLANAEITGLVLGSLLINFIVRFLGTVLMHAVASAVFGYFWAMLRLTKKKITMFLIAVPIGLLLATLVHSLFNYMMMGFDFGLFRIVAFIAFIIIIGKISLILFKRLKTFKHVIH